MPGELDSTEVQLARFFGRTAAVASSPGLENALSPMTSFVPSPSTEDYSSPAMSRASSRPTSDSSVSSTASCSMRTAQFAEGGIVKGLQEMSL